jgi:AP-3 complex subunit delta-1
MMGYNMSWASFATIEVMSSTRFAYKRIGYLAAIQAFTQDTEVILLATNLLKKELRGAVGPGMHGVYEAGLAINCLANIVTEDLARELLPDVTDLISHAQPYLRKKALLCLFKIFVKYPQALRLTFGRIQQTLTQDPHPSVVSCAVNVITELSDKNPKNYLALAPTFFDLLTKSNNNWMLIKVVKLLGSLVSEEPRLARKLLEPLAKIVQSTQAKSLLYEAVYAITLCLPHCRKSDGSMPSSVPSIVDLCAKTMKEFVEDTDQNLKYLGLVGFGSLMVSHPKVLSASDYRPLILTCLSDDDVTIRKRALDLLIGMATRKNIIELVTQLLRHVDLATGRYKADLVVKILEICSSEKYSLIPDFAWYVDVLVILARTRGIGGFLVREDQRLGDFVSSLIFDVALRVLPVRPYLVRRMIGILLEKSVEHAAARITSKELQRHGVSYDGQYIVQEILSAAAWIVGEYSTLIVEALAIHSDNQYDEDELDRYDADSTGTFHALIQALTDVSNVDTVALSTQSIFIQSSAKLLAAAALEPSQVKDGELDACLITLGNNLPLYMQSLDTEVQERAFSFFHLLLSLGLLSSGLSPNVNNFSGPSRIRNDGDEYETLIGRNPPHALPVHGSTKADTCRYNASKLKLLYISEHMKPASSKSQQKKRAAVTGKLQTLLNRPVDFSIFSGIITEDKVQRPTTVSKNYLDVVSFTHQKINIVSHTVADIMTDDDGFASLLFNERDPQSSNTMRNAKPHDPFILKSSSGNADNVILDTAYQSSKRFGTIQLVVSDDENLKDHDRRKSKKNRRKDRKQDVVAQINTGYSDNMIKDATKMQQVYLSDDESDDGARGSMGRGKKSQSSHLRGFESLAMVDLTQPFHDDEVVHRRSHNSVAEVKSDWDGQENAKLTSSNKDKKKKKDRSLKRDKATHNGSATIDLLDLESFNIADNSMKTMNNVIAPSRVVTNNPMDDLLSLSLPVQDSASVSTNIPRRESVSSVSSAVSKDAIELWQEAKLKYSHIKGNGQTINWEKISLLYRTFLSKGNENKAVVSFQLVNNGIHGTLTDIRLTLSESDSVITFDDVQPGASIRSAIKAGTFSISETLKSKEIRGNLVASGWTIPFKLTLPSVCYLFTPESISMEEISDQISKGGFFQYTTKLTIPANYDLVRVKSLLKFFLSAGEVKNDGVPSFVSYLLASCSSKGQVLTFVKIHDGVIKLDLKAKDESLGQAIAWDLKRIRFV